MFHEMEVLKSGTPCFLCQSLLLSTTILNDSLVRLILQSYYYIVPCFTVFMATYTTVQLNLNFIYACGYTRARTCFTQVKVLKWSVSSLLHMDLSCTFMRLNSCGTPDMHHTSELITNTCSVNCNTHVTTTRISLS